MRRAVLVILLAVVVVIAGTSAGVALWLRRYGPPPELLIQRADGNLALLDAQGQRRQLTTDADGRTRSYGFPTPAPNGRSVAYVETVRTTDAISSSLVVHRLQGARRVLFGSRDAQPFYLYWSPDSAHIAFLTGDTGGMMLRTVNAQGTPVPQQIIPGQPSYFSWTPDSRRLLLHTGGSAPGGSLSLWSIGDDMPRTWETQPSMFQAPAWLEDGRTAVAAITDGPDAALARLDDAGNVLQKLATSRSGMLFVMSPSRELVAYVPLSIGGAGNLRIVGVDGNGDREAIATPVLTFLWSPDSTKLAFLTTASETDRTVAFKAQATLTLRWNVLDLPTGEARALKSFEPTEAFLNLLPFFDQYAQSIRLWDQASRRLVYADPAGVWTLDVVSGEAARIDEGVLGMWMEH